MIHIDGVKYMKDTLKINSVVNERYLITEIFNTNLNNEVIYKCKDITIENDFFIKEFCPDDAERKENGELLYKDSYKDDLKVFIHKNKENMKFNMLPTVVEVEEVFSSNNTAYAVCTYYRGQTIDEILNSKILTFSENSVRRALISILKTEEALFNIGFLLKNIHPKNIIVTDDSYIKLLEFDIDVVTKDEKYVVYSIAALGYCMLLGKNEDALDKLIKKEFKDSKILRYLKDIINTKAENSTISEFLKDISFNKVDKIKERKSKPDKRHKIKNYIWLSIVASLTCVLIVIGIIELVNKPIQLYFEVPDVIGYTDVEAKEKLASRFFNVEILYLPHETVEKGKVFDQNIKDEQYATGSTITITVSTGKIVTDGTEYLMPLLIGKTFDDAKEKLTELNLYIEQQQKDVDNKENIGKVIGQSIAESEKVIEGTKVILTVGSNGIVIPDVRNKDLKTAENMIESAGAYVKIVYEQSNKIQKGNVIRQNAVGKSTYGVTVTVTVSSGKNKSNNPPVASSNISDTIPKTDNDVTEENNAVHKHVWSNWKYMDSTYHKKSCECGVTEKDAHGFHAEKIEKPATCMEDGKKVLICTSCQSKKEEVIFKKSHHYVKEEKIMDESIKDTVCYTEKCNECGDKLSQKHQWRVLEETLEKKVERCENCSREKTTKL